MQPLATAHLEPRQPLVFPSAALAISVDECSTRRSVRRRAEFEVVLTRMEAARRRLCLQSLDLCDDSSYLQFVPFCEALLHYLLIVALGNETPGQRRARGLSKTMWGEAAALWESAEDILAACGCAPTLIRPG